jgi:hypothetical protein
MPASDGKRTIYIFHANILFINSYDKQPRESQKFLGIECLELAIGGDIIE